MKILLSYHSGWLNTGYDPEKYFQALGDEVNVFHLEHSPYWTDWHNLLPFYFPKGLPIHISSMEKKYKTRFDAAIELDGSSQYHLLSSKDRKYAKILWSSDTHLYQKRKFHLYFQKDFDIIFTSHKQYVDAFKQTECRWLPGACDPNIQNKMNLPKIFEIAFSGNLDPRYFPDRFQLLQKLSKKFKVGLFDKSHYGTEANKIWNQTKIAFHRSRYGELNYRIFEVLASGTFLITDRIESGLFDLFEEGKHLVTYDSYQELEEKVAYYLSHDEERERIALEGHKEAVHKHTYYHRAQEILKWVKHSS